MPRCMALNAASRRIIDVKVPVRARPMKPRDTVTGRRTMATPTPRRFMMWPVRKSWSAKVATWVQKSSWAKRPVRWSTSVVMAATSLSRVK